MGAEEVLAARLLVRRGWVLAEGAPRVSFGGGTIEESVVRRNEVLAGSDVLAAAGERPSGDGY